jgi:glycosyltransferase involved in cell wall biosynthesis
MKVAYLTTNLDPFAGWGRYSLEIVQRLPRMGIEPVVLVERGSPEVSLAGVAVHAVLHRHKDAMRNPTVWARDGFAARRVIAECAFVHCLAEPHLATANFMCRGSRRLLTTAVGTYAVTILDGPWRAMFRHAYRAAVAIPAISRYTGERLAHKLPEVAGKIVAIPLGVTPLAETRFPPASAREPAFLAVGAVKRRKGTHLIVEALGRLAGEFPDIKLYIAGDASDKAYVEEVERAIARHRLESHVVWLGQIPEPELAQIYDRVRGLVMPSLNHEQHFEGFGLVHLEANARGVPAIGSRGCGNEDAIRHGYSGYLIEQGNVDQLAGAMSALLRSDADWNAMSRNAVELARSMDWARTASAYAQLYKA